MLNEINIYQNTVRVIMRIAADGTLAAASTDPEIAEIVCILVIVHSQTDAQLASSVAAFLHHLRKCLIPTTLAIMFFQFEFLHLYYSLDYVFLSLPSTALPVVQILRTCQCHLFINKRVLSQFFKLIVKCQPNK